MDLPDCPPGAEGYEDSVTEVPKKPDDPDCTKAEQEFQKHLNSLKIKLEDGSTRPMVERKGRDISGKWTYVCYPCAAICSGESILQTHISGKKHKNKLGSTTAWPLSVFDEDRFNNTKNSAATTVTDKVLQKMSQEVEIHNLNDNDHQFNKFLNATCHIQDALDEVKTPLVALEYLIEHAPEEVHYSPTYMCTLCTKQGQPRTIINHLTSVGHRFNFISRHFPKACRLLAPYRTQVKFRDGVAIIVSRLVQRIEDKYGRKRPINIDKEEYEKNKDLINQWICKSHHFAEKEDCTFEEVVDIGLLDTLNAPDTAQRNILHRKEPSPPVVAAPSKPQFNNFSRNANRRERRAGSVESLSDISDVDMDVRRDSAGKTDRNRDKTDRRGNSPPRSKYPPKYSATSNSAHDKTRAPNYEYKMKLAASKSAVAEECRNKALAYHEKNPEKHPLYPEEWKKFWNRRYKEIQAEGKDPSKHDFKPEWIVFWTARMKVLHDEELRVTVNEIYRKMCLSPPPAVTQRSTRESPKKSESARRLRSPERRRRSQEQRRHSPEQRRHSPERRRPTDSRHRSPPRRRSPPPRRDRDYNRSPGRQDRRSPGPARRRSPVVEHNRSPPPSSHRIRTRSRSPLRRRSPVRPRPPLELIRRSRSPLSQRELQPRNRSPERRDPPPSMQTVLISDDDLMPEDSLSPWNSDNEMMSVASLGSRATSAKSSRKRARRDDVHVTESTAPDDVVATLRLLVALEDYLGSLGPKLVDLLAEALKMEKDKANSSEELLDRESAVVLMETAKEKLKGAAQAGLVTGSAATAARAAVVRAAATLHEADKRARRKASSSAAKSSGSNSKQSGVPVAGVGEVDRAQIAQQMAEALIAQGKTDVSSEELAQLVDAVVGMAEAKKREAERRQPEIRPQAYDTAKQNPPAPTQRTSQTASALQMLQSAYDENDKKTEKDEAPDAMDGLSDSDLETLLKNFNELSAEEQHSLIAYLKKLEAKEPARVERLRQYVSDAAPACAPAAAPAGPAPPAPPPSHPPRPSSERDHVVLDSDDDDYTVEEVFQSATQKVKEDQIRQEMEIVKKSLEESKPDTKVVTIDSASIDSLADITRQLSSASGLFALVQASIKSSSAPTPAPEVTQPELVVSNTQPRSFGDLPESSMTSKDSKEAPHIPPSDNQPPVHITDSLQNFMDTRKLLSPSVRFNQGNQPSNENHDDDRFNQGPGDRFDNSSQPATDRFNQEQPPNDRFNQMPPVNNRFNQIVPPPSDRFNQSVPPPSDRFNQNVPPSNDRFNQNGPPPNDRFNQAVQPQNQNDQFNQGNQQYNDRFNQGNQQPNDRFKQGNYPQNDTYNQGNQPPSDRFNQNNQPTNERYNYDNQMRNDRFNQGNQQGPNNAQYNQGPNQWNARPQIPPVDNRGPQNRGSLLGTPDNYGPGGQFNQGPRPNFMNSRGQDNYDNRQQNQQFGNQNNFRGRGGRGNYRGRGRGYH